MARGRTAVIQLVRLLDAVDRPIYVLDDEQAIVFCNLACLAWIGREAEEVLGKKCVYAAAAESADPVAAGLCPPPAALTGQEMAGVVGCPLPDGRLTRRTARFVPLRGEADAVAGVIALVEPEDLTDSQSACLPACETEAARLHERLRLFRQRMAARYRLDRFIGDSPAIRRARSQVQLAAASRANVLIVGPPGSGREHAAHAIHYGAAAEPGGPLVPLACTVLGADLIGSTLAAIASRRLPQEAAGPRTLLLNDVDQLAGEAQGEIARVLLTGEFPLRVISTTRHALVELAREGEFREDLAAVLSTLVIDLPPLAERRGDLPLLAQLFVEEANARSGKQLAGLSPEALDCLEAYPWPGNLDELIRMLDEAHNKAEGVEIGVNDLPRQIHLAQAAAAHPRRPEETIVLEEFLARIERELLARAMARAKGNKTKAAKLLGMTRPRLYRRLVQLGLEKPEAGEKG